MPIRTQPGEKAPYKTEAGLRRSCPYSSGEGGEYVNGAEENEEPDLGGYRTPVYGDLSELNKSRVILDAVGPELLSEIVYDYLNLLGTSSAVYERNGDYAMGIIASGWCRCLDHASRQLCDTPDNRVALASGKWLCHDSCWKDASLAAMESGRSVDVACPGGLRIFAVPILAGEEIVGAINFGYGSPPGGLSELEAIAERYHLGQDELQHLSEHHPPTSPLLVGIAQGMLHTAAKLIGEIVYRRQVEKELENSQQQFRLTFEQAAVGIAHVAPDGRWLEINQRFCEIVGYSRDEMLQLTFQDITHPDDLETDLGYVRQVLSGAINHYSMEKRYYHKSGSIVWVNLTVSPMRDPEGETQYFIAVIEDITSRKNAEEERDSILDNSNDLICVACVDGYFKYVNPAWTKVLGYSQEELLSRPFMDFIHPDDHEANDAEVDNLKRGNRTSDFENRYIAKDGSVHTVSWTATPQTDAGLFYCFGRDITIRKQEEQKRHELEQQLRQSQKLEALGRLAAGVAHDFNNALAAVVGHADVARMALPPSHVVNKDLDGILRASEHAASVAKSLLLLSRDSATDMKPIHLGRVVSKAVRMLEHILPASVELVLEIEESPDMTIEGDDVQINQIVMNLVVNSRDAMPDGGQVTVSVFSREGNESTGCVEDACRHVCLSVSDTGVGMSEDEQARIFDPFYSTKERGRGTGLGMAVVHGIVDSHHGDIFVSSEEGKGTVIEIQFPRSSLAEKTVDSNVPVTPAPGQSDRILIAEDNPSVAGILQKGLEMSGYHVQVVSNGVEAVSILQEPDHEIQLAILDVDMPQMSGLECREAIRQLDPDFPVILVSGFVDSSLSREEKRHLLLKPFKVAELILKVQELLKVGV